MATNPIQRAMAEIVEVLDEQTTPAKMSKEEYLELLEELSGDLEMRIEATREELAVDE